MTTKPATPLPWTRSSVSPERFPRYLIASGEHNVAEVPIMAHGRAGADAAYIAHACNAYPRLVEALRLAAHTAISGLDGNPTAACEDVQRDAQALLRELGEEV